MRPPHRLSLPVGTTPSQIGHCTHHQQRWRSIDIENIITLIDPGHGVGKIWAGFTSKPPSNLKPNHCFCCTSTAVRTKHLPLKGSNQSPSPYNGVVGRTLFFTCSPGRASRTAGKGEGNVDHQKEGAMTHSSETEPRTHAKDSYRGGSRVVRDWHSQ